MVDPDIFRVMSTVSFVGASLLIATYMPTGWWRQSFGRSFMLLAIATWMFTLASSLRQWLGEDYFGRTEVRIAAQAVLIVALYSALVVLVRALRADRRR